MELSYKWHASVHVTVRVFAFSEAYLIKTTFKEANWRYERQNESFCQWLIPTPRVRETVYHHMGVMCNLFFSTKTDSSLQ